ncbi:MAG: hypothetical protein SFV19_14390 [Rhodospirillaceae bacterium]|nr:hypothetical protein [Rhodospirillaceae bacterium]
MKQQTIESGPTSLQELKVMVSSTAKKYRRESIRSKRLYQFTGSVTSIAAVVGPTALAGYTQLPSEYVNANTNAIMIGIIIVVAILGALINLNNYFQWNKEYRVLAIACLDMKMLEFEIDESLRRLALIQSEARLGEERQDLGKFLLRYQSIVRKKENDSIELVPMN